MTPSTRAPYRRHASKTNKKMYEYVYKGASAKIMTNLARSAIAESGARVVGYMLYGLARAMRECCAHATEPKMYIHKARIQSFTIESQQVFRSPASEVTLNLVYPHRLRRHPNWPGKHQIFDGFRNKQAMAHHSHTCIWVPVQAKEPLMARLAGTTG